MTMLSYLIQIRDFENTTDNKGHLDLVAQPDFKNTTHYQPERIHTKSKRFCRWKLFAKMPFIYGTTTSVGFSHV